MNKTAVNTFIKNMEKAGLVTKAAPWTMEAARDGEFHVRFVGLKVGAEWSEIFSSVNNLLVKFNVNRFKGWLEVYLANKPPFLKLTSTSLTSTTKWETVLGELKRRLKKDKEAFLQHTHTVDNVYAKMKPYLK